MTKHNIRYGLAAGRLESPEQWRETARKAQDLGYSVLLLADHLGQQWAPLPALIAAAEATTTLRVGTQVLANDFRRPVVLAKEIATMDVLTGGRFEPGIGVGHPATSPIGRSDYNQLGIEMDEPGPRVTRFEESLRLIKQFLHSDEKFDFEGEFYKAKDVVPSPSPVQKPHPPIMVAGAGPRMLRLCAREADIINIAPRPPIKGTTTRGRVGFGLAIQDELEILKGAASSRYDDLELCVFAESASLTDDAGTAVEELAAAFEISTEAAQEMPHTLIGNIGQMEEKVLLDKERYGVTYRIVQGPLMEALAPLVKATAGR